MANFKCPFKLFRNPEWKVSRHSICGPLLQLIQIYISYAALVP